jgi:hypothetical protein
VYFCLSYSGYCFVGFVGFIEFVGIRSTFFFSVGFYFGGSRELLDQILCDGWKREA